MEIQYFGNSSFRIRGSKAIILTDPLLESEGLKMPKTTADIITLSGRKSDYGVEHNKTYSVLGTARRTNPFEISGPGEYEVSDIFILGLPSLAFGKKRNTIYVINIEGMRFVHLGKLKGKLEDATLEEINGAEVLFVPVGGEAVMEAGEAVELVRKVEPMVVVPMCYDLPGLSLKYSSVEEFLSGIGKKEVQPVAKLSIAKEALLEEQQVVVLAAK